MVFLCICGRYLKPLNNISLPWICFLRKCFILPYITVFYPILPKITVFYLVFYPAFILLTDLEHWRWIFFSFGNLGDLGPLSSFLVVSRCDSLPLNASTNWKKTLLHMWRFSPHLEKMNSPYMGNSPHVANSPILGLILYWRLGLWRLDWDICVKYSSVPVAWHYHFHCMIDMT